MKSYSFNNVSMLVNGVEMTGWPEGDDAIVCERLNDSAEHVVGVDGSMTVSLSTDRSGTITFNLMQNSDSNLELSSLVTAQENGAFIPIFVQIKNTEGTELISGTQGYLQRPANLQFGKNLQPVQWVIVTERLDIFNAGSEAA